MGEVPPFVGVAVNVTLAPEQIAEPGVPVIVTSGVTCGVIVTEISLEFPEQLPLVTIALYRVDVRTLFTV